MNIKQVLVKVVFALLLMSALPVQAQIRIGGSGKDNADTSSNWPSLGTFFENIIERYPVDVQLFEDERFIPRLVALVGQARVDYMRSHFDFEYPIEDTGKCYSIMACRTGECGYCDFEIQYFPDKNVMCVKYLLDGVQEVYKEKEINNVWTEYNTEEEDLGPEVGG